MALFYPQPDLEANRETNIFRSMRVSSTTLKTASQRSPTEERQRWPFLHSQRISTRKSAHEVPDFEIVKFAPELA